ncbi:MAG: hypothetical protein IT331_02140 [Anaerolineae bacterium]|nr:hypothetical protein [Anaerolineae bacterium]
MIVLDENLQDRRIRDAIAQWYQGQVVSIRELRPGTVIKDDAIPSLLQRADQATFITINADDFWLRVQPSQRFCILVFDLPKERSLEIPQLARAVLQNDLLKSKAARMGKIIRWSPTLIEYYESNRRIQQMESH